MQHFEINSMRTRGKAIKAMFILKKSKHNKKGKTLRDLIFLRRNIFGLRRNVFVCCEVVLKAISGFAAPKHTCGKTQGRDEVEGRAEIA